MADVVTRLYFMRLRRLTNEALAQGGVTPELTHARQEHVPTFTHFLDIPMLSPHCVARRHKAKYMDPIHHRGVRCFSYGNSPNLVDTAPLPLGPADLAPQSRVSWQLQAQV